MRVCSVITNEVLEVTYFEILQMLILLPAFKHLNRLNFLEAVVP